MAVLPSCEYPPDCGPSEGCGPSNGVHGGPAPKEPEPRAAILQHNCDGDFELLQGEGEDQAVLVYYDGPAGDVELVLESVGAMMSGDELGRIVGGNPNTSGTKNTGTFAPRPGFFSGAAACAPRTGGRGVGNDPNQSGGGNSGPFSRPDFFSSKR